MSYSNAPPMSYLPTLVIHSQPAAAEQLVNRLKRAGCLAETAIGCREAKAAVRARGYGSMIFVGGLSNPAQRRCIAGLRRLAPRTWFIGISSVPLTEAEEASLRPDVDAFVYAPFSIRELASRLSAFSLRSRPP